MLADVIDRVPPGADLFRILVGNLDVEGLLEGHDEFDGVERVCAQVVHEGSAGSYLALIHAQLLDDNLLHLLINGCHVSPRLPRLDLKFAAPDAGCSIPILPSGCWGLL